MTYDISQQGIDFLEELEGKRNRMYPCTRGYPTIGVGHRIFPGYEMVVLCGQNVNLMFDKLTEGQIDELTRQDIERYKDAVVTAVGHVVNQHQFDACVSLCINLGRGVFISSDPNVKATFVKRIQKYDPIDKVIEAIMWWVKNPELIGRRSCEARLYKTGNYYTGDKQYLNWTYEHNRF